MIETADRIAEFQFRVHQEIDIAAPRADVFEAIFEEITTGIRDANGGSMNLRIERWPGGRWYRDLGKDIGHFWGHVQVIKPPVVLEICGPMMMSYPVAGHIAYRLTETPTGTRLTLTHRAFGEIDPAHREGVNQGWDVVMKAIKTRAQR